MSKTWAALTLVQRAEIQPLRHSGCNPTNQTDSAGAASCGETIYWGGVAAVGMVKSWVGLATSATGVGLAWAVVGHYVALGAAAQTGRGISESC